ncbi:MAG: hypothetical protein VKO21_11170 [Candidatus Sericytochromatia bacterium]|nr:hypothetical protein [Candidatus Sericytochromatia bacterium]
MNRRAVAVVMAAALLAGCGGESRTSDEGDRYVSAQVSGDKDAINLDAVHEAFFKTQGKDFDGWMQAFEKRVNEIHEGEGVVAIDARRKDGMVKVTGYLDEDSQPGFDERGDRKLFALEQTGAAEGAKGFPYQVTGAQGQPFFQGYPPPQYHSGSLLDNPFVQFMVLNQIFNGGFGYNTPWRRTTVLRNHRDTFRSSPSWRQQTARNKGFVSRWFGKKEPVTSRRGFGSWGSGTSTKRSGSASSRRSWFGGSGGTGSSWGGRRSSGYSGGGARRSWGGRRR